MKSIIKNKKGYTLIEIIVTVAILTTLTSIAIPVVAYRLDQANKNSALTNAHTIEYAIKEAQAAQIARDTTIYPNANTEPITISEVARCKAIAKAFEPVTYKSETYYPVWSEDRVYFVNGTTTIDGKTLEFQTEITATSDIEVILL